MIVLALDTAGVDCSVAVYDGNDGRILASSTETLGKGHAERLMSMIAETLAASGLRLEDVQRIGVTIGPGSFTGIRTGVAAARGLALALGIPVAGISTLAILAAAWRDSHGEQPVIAAIDAKRGEIYAQPFDAGGVPLDRPQAVDADGLLALCQKHGADAYGSGAALGGGATAGAEPDHFPIALAARLVHALDDPEKPKPLYLRAPDAKPQAGFALSRT